MLQHILSRYFASFPDAIHNPDAPQKDPLYENYETLDDSDFFPVDILMNAFRSTYAPAPIHEPQTPPSNVTGVFDLWNSLSFAIGTQPPTTAPKKNQDVENSTQSMVQLVNAHIDTYLDHILRGDDE